MSDGVMVNHQKLSGDYIFSTTLQTQNFKYESVTVVMKESIFHSELKDHLTRQSPSETI